ncbi:Hypothetical protein KVN_LOCUS367 [uncultured virus]|nr:Hypothetical protein KVN_LOCUS367 [uncultured virus]
MINIIQINNKLYKYESFWRNDKNLLVYDFYGKILPFPEEKNWQNRKLFLIKLKETEEYLKSKNEFKKYDASNYKNCILDGQKNITTGYFQIGKLRWESGLYHYIDKHFVKPSDEFIDTIFKYSLEPNILHTKKLSKIPGLVEIVYNKRYLKINRNQLLIMDALMKHGGYKLYVDENNKSLFRYSEHSGLLDFNDNKLEKIIVSGNTVRTDKNDKDIFLPQNMIEAFDYEYFFHTHPPTPKPGSRAKLGILFEFPSISDIFHFVDHYNEGKTQGSIVIAPEGLYIIRKLNMDNKKIKINEDNLYSKTMDSYMKVQNDALKIYGVNFSQNTFFSKISQDMTFINEINKILNKFQINIDYYPRVQDKKNRWILDTIYIPIYPIEPKTN